MYINVCIKENWSCAKYQMMKSYIVWSFEWGKEWINWTLLYKKLKSDFTVVQRWFTRCRSKESGKHNDLWLKCAIILLPGECNDCCDWPVWQKGWVWIVSWNVWHGKNQIYGEIPWNRAIDIFSSSLHNPYHLYLTLIPLPYSYSSSFFPFLSNIVPFTFLGVFSLSLFV